MSYPYQKHIWVTKEVIRREYLQNIEDGIYDEQQERLLQEGLINDAITAEENRAKGAEQTLTNNLSAEVTRAQGAESTISSDLSDEVRRAQGAESELATDITNLGGRITDESTRALAAESALSTSVSNEVTRAQGAESTLSTQITNEVNRATAAEADLRSIATRAYKASGSVYFADLPALDASRQGNVYNIKDDFTTTSDFVEGSGKDYPAGTNVAIVSEEGDYYTEVTPEGTENPSEEGWYVLDDGYYVLTEDTQVVSGTTYYSYSDSALKYDVEAGFIDTSDFITNTDYANTQTPGIVKPDGITTFVDANGVLSSAGGGAAADNFTGTNAEWEALTDAQKAEYHTLDIEDDYGGYIITKILTSTLTAGATSLTFTNSAITSTSLIDVYTNTWGINPTNIVASTGEVTLTFDAQSSNVSVRLLVIEGGN